ncbi:MAG: hypothetical protein M1608_11800, partial [Candidatus Omnitrophica bacterium]|nr:hypothetical protein [Candidatus Omnitrophota bacterium]
GMDNLPDPVTGGVAALNHRLMALKPPGSQPVSGSTRYTIPKKTKNFVSRTVDINIGFAIAVQKQRSTASEDVDFVSIHDVTNAVTTPIVRRLAAQTGFVPTSFVKLVPLSRHHFVAERVARNMMANESSTLHPFLGSI